MDDYDWNEAMDAAISIVVKKGLATPHCAAHTRMLVKYLEKEKMDIDETDKEVVLTKSEILEKVKELEYKKRCVNVRICPTCGQDLVSAFNGSSIDRVCKACNQCWDYIQNGF